jgi:alpha/beta superfamily hydrolase
MDFPKFLVADNTDLQDAIFIVHTEFPAFILNLENDEVKWLDDITDESEGDLTKTLEGLIAEAEDFYTREVERYNL